VADLQKRLATKEQTERWLNQKIAQLQRMLFGQKRERFEGDPDQGRLPFEASAEQHHQQETRHEEEITYVRNTPSKSNHNGRLPLPDHLPVEEIEIFPDGDLKGMVCIGKEVTEELELTPARFYIKRYIRYKYASKDQSGGGVHIGELPERPIDKGIAGPGLLATILVDKYVDHLPLYRQRQRFLREHIPIAQTTLDGWASQAMDRLEILYNRLAAETSARGYLQVDESRIKVLESRKKGSCHQGWYWVYHSPIEKTVLFDYQPTRGAPAPKRLLDGFKGYLQTDGYSVYTKIGAREDITHLACWAHARREFEKALDNDRGRRWRWDIFRPCTMWSGRPVRKSFRQTGAKNCGWSGRYPLSTSWATGSNVSLPGCCPKAKLARRWPIRPSGGTPSAATCRMGVSRLTTIWWRIRSVRWPWAAKTTCSPQRDPFGTGSHKAAQRAAMVYSLLGTCKMHGVNPTQWLTHVLANILQTKYNDVQTLYPQNFSQP